MHERYRRQTDDRQTDGRQHIANVNVSSRSLKISGGGVAAKSKRSCIPSIILAHASQVGAQRVGTDSFILVDALSSPGELGVSTSMKLSMPTRCASLLPFVMKHQKPRLNCESVTGSRFCILVMAALWNRAGHYIFAHDFYLSFFYLFSSPNLSDRRLAVYHTSTHGVALVRI